MVLRIGLRAPSLWVLGWVGERDEQEERTRVVFEFLGWCARVCVCACVS